MSPDGVTLTVGLPEGLRGPAARLYLDAFGAKLGPILGRGLRAEAYLAQTFRAGHAVAALDGEGRLIGLAGFHDGAGGFVGGGGADLARAYGWPGALWRRALFTLFERAPGPGQLLVDGMAVAPAQRGRGVGAALVGRLAALAREKGLVELRLEVVDSNPRARALYERLGFAVVGARSLGPLAPLFGFRRAATMTRAV